jgi:hypothetical protein
VSALHLQTVDDRELNKKKLFPASPRQPQAQSHCSLGKQEGGASACSFLAPHLPPPLPLHPMVRSRPACFNSGEPQEETAPDKTERSNERCK